MSESGVRTQLSIKFKNIIMGNCWNIIIHMAILKMQMNLICDVFFVELELLFLMDICQDCLVEVLPV